MAMASSGMGYGNGVFPATEGAVSHAPDSAVSSWYEGSETFYVPEKRDVHKGQAHAYANPGHMNNTAGSIVESAVYSAGVRLSDTHLASRKAVEAATRRQQAILWLQDAVGDLGLSSRSTEEDLRLSLRNGISLCKLINKVQPGAVLKVVANTALSNHLDGAQSALQYFENVRNFLVAVEEMGLPSFEVSDLEQGSMSSNSSAKLVDCILALKSYNDWKQGGALGFWRLKSPSHPTVNKNIPVPKLSRSKSTNNSSNARKKWAIPDPESLDDTSVTSSSNEAPTFEPDSSVSGHETSANGQSEETTSSVGDGEEAAYSEISSAVSKSNWLQHLGEKFHEVLQVNAKSLHGITDTIPITFDGYDGKSISALDNAPSQSLLSLISAILCDKTVEEVPVVVEFMLRKVMEEFERHLVAQRKQVAKMKSSIQEIMAREAKLTSQNSVIVTLVAGTQEEIKLHAEMLHKTEAEMMALKEEKRAKEEEIGRLLQENEEKHSAVQMLKNELDRIKRTDKELLERLESQKREFELECQANIKSLELQLQDSHEKLEELKLNSAREMSSLRMKDTQYQTFLSNQLVEYKNLRLSQLNTKDEFSRMQMEWSNQFSVLEEQLHNMARAASGYHKVLAENRVLYNEVQDLKGNIRVYCRVRPFLKEEIGNLSTLDYVGENGELMLVNPLKPGAKDSRKSFVFNKCFAPNSSQEEVYLDTQPLIRSVLDGFNVCIFAYGQTGSGKTFTMSGPNNMTPTDWGVNYRALHDLFHTTQSRQDVFQYEIGVQMLEIYNEQVRDLLSVDGVQKKLEIRNNSGLNGLNVPDATMMSVGSTEDVLDLMKLGQRNRAVGATALNERSSRSHSVLTVHVQGTDLESGAILRGSLHLVDLAGSERVDRSEATGDRLKEAQHINKSLSALGDVIAALAQKNGHVPYRNSKLTQLLQDSLGGQAKTLMFVHISPDVESFGETVSTLKFAERVSTVELGAARSNKESGEIQNLKEQISLLKEAAAKKDAEISNLQTFKERFERGECGVGVEKFKSRPSKPTSRVRASIDTTAVQKVRVVQNEAASGAVEHRPKTRKLPGESKAPLRVGVTSSHDPEDLSEQVVSSSACSPASSPTGQWGIFNIIEDGVKLKYLKNQENGSDSGVTNRTFQNHNTTKTDSGQFLVKERSKSMPEAVLAHHVEASLSGIRDEVKELPKRSQHGAEESGTFSQEVEKQRFNANGGSLYEAGNGDSEAIRSVCSSQRSLQGLEDQLESDGIFDLRDGYDDSSSLFSESGLSVEADQSSTTTQLEQSKKSQSSLTQARRSVSLQSQVPRPPISKKSSLVMDRKSVGAPLQPRHRRLPSAGVTSSTDKLSHMRTPSLGAVANTEFESSGNRRVAIGAGSSTSWR